MSHPIKINKERLDLTDDNKDSATWIKNLKT